MIASLPVFAANNADDFLRIAVLLVIFVVPLIGKLLAKIRKFPPPNERPIPPPAKLPDATDEIQKVMRHAAQKHREQLAKRTQPKPKPPVAAKPIRAEVVSDGPVGGRLSQHVTQYLDEQKFAQREGELGREVAEADNQISQHLHQTFDHQVSQLSNVQGEAAASTTAYEPNELGDDPSRESNPFAAGLFELIGNPESLRQVIILNEILGRPEDRWS
jgi:hypothetical protein